MADPLTMGLISAGGNVLSSIGGSLLSGKQKHNSRQWSGTPSYPVGFMEGFSEMHPYPGITGPPESSGWQPPEVEMKPGIEHDGRIPLSWIKQAYAANRPDKLGDLSRWLRDHNIPENAEYLTQEEFGQMAREGFGGMSGTSQGAISAVASDIQSRQRLGRAANQFYAGAREEQSGGAPQQGGVPFAMPGSQQGAGMAAPGQGGDSFEAVAQTAQALFGPSQGTTPGQLQALPGGPVPTPTAPQRAEAPPAVPPMPDQAQMPPMPDQMIPSQPAASAQAGFQPPAFPGTDPVDPMGVAPELAQAIQEQIQTDPLRPATENNYTQQLLAALQRDLNTPFVG